MRDFFDEVEVNPVPALKVSQPVGEFYQAVIPWRVLIRISKADVRAMHDDKERELDRYIGIQRKLDKKREKDIVNYVNRVGATFPTSVVLAVSEGNIEWDERNRMLSFIGSEGVPIDEVAKILDGQHRIEGLRGFKGGDSEFDVPVTIFVGADMPTQANIFATVNLAQTKVNRSLVYDLFDYESSRSPQKTCHEIAVALDDYEYSPFLRRIKRLGTATPGRGKEVLTQAVVVESLIEFIADDPWEDRNKIIKKIFTKNYSDPKKIDKYIFRSLWIDGKDSEIVAILLGYFNAVKRKWPKSWDDFERQGNVLPKSNGFRALMRFLRPAYQKLEPDYRNTQRVITAEEFYSLFEKIEMKDDDFNIETFPPGTSGESKLFKILESSL